MAFGVISSLAALSASANIAGSTESMAVASAHSSLKIVKPSGNELPLNGFNEPDVHTGPGQASETEGGVGMATMIPGLFVGDRIAEALVLVAHAEATSILLYWSEIETSAQAILDANVDDFVVAAWIQ